MKFVLPARFAKIVLELYYNSAQKRFTSNVRREELQDFEGNFIQLTETSGTEESRLLWIPTERVI
jgi:hypothetical protein